jgi:long-chain acyl-CoA synthetase
VRPTSPDDLTLSATGANAPPFALTASSPAMLMYTSGTTGTPKGALLSHGNLVHAGKAVSAAHELSPSDRVLSSLPLYHVNGQCIGTISPLVSGGSIVMPHRFSLSQWWPWSSAIGRPGSTSCRRSSPIFSTARIPRRAGGGLPRRALRALASAPLPPEHHRAFEARFGISVLEGMGLTECASVAFANPLDPAARKIGSPGLPLGLEARVVVRAAPSCRKASGARSNCGAAM